MKPSPLEELRREVAELQALEKVHASQRSAVEAYWREVAALPEPERARVFAFGETLSLPWEPPSWVPLPSPEAMKDARERIRQYRPPGARSPLSEPFLGPWTPISARPEVDGEYLLVQDDGCRVVADFKAGRQGAWDSGDENYSPERVTHYMPLPEGPEDT